MIRHIVEAHGDGYKSYGLVIRFRPNLKPSDQGLNFLTQPHEAMQVAHMVHPAGKVIANHFHNCLPRKTDVCTPEILFVRSGKVKVSIFNNDQKIIDTIVLLSGDVLFQFAGGHGFEMLEESDIVETKLGPYAGDDKEKTKF